jgi:hypothetical protein
MKLYAEDSNYWDTTVHPAKSLGEVQELLEDFGVKNMIVTQGKAGGQLAWIVDKFKEWTFPSGDLPEKAIHRDRMLTDVTIYWLTGTEPRRTDLL